MDSNGGVIETIDVPPPNANDINGNTNENTNMTTPTPSILPVQDQTPPPELSYEELLQQQIQGMAVSSNNLASSEMTALGENVLFVKRLVQHAIVPLRASAGAAGYDLYACENVQVQANRHALVPTGISIKLPTGTYGRVAPRSGLAVKKCIDVLAGVIDEDYRGEIIVVLMNHGDSDFEVKRGDRIAQLVLEKIAIVPVREVATLPETARGAGGFGSTGDN